MPKGREAITHNCTSARRGGQGGDRLIRGGQLGAKKTKKYNYNIYVHMCVCVCVLCVCVCVCERSWGLCSILWWLNEKLNLYVPLFPLSLFAGGVCVCVSVCVFRGRYVVALGRSWHPEEFTCCQCKVLL